MVSRIMWECDKEKEESLNNQYIRYGTLHTMIILESSEK